MQTQIHQTLIELVCGDITREETDAIVNAANSRLVGGAGVDGAIHRAGGPAIMAECRQIGGCPTGEAVITTGGNLRARHVIHTVGPVYRGGGHGEAHLLASAYRNSLKLACKHGLHSIAFPAISCGVYGYPVREAAHLALQTCVLFVREHTDIQRIRHVLFDQRTFDIFAQELKNIVQSRIYGAFMEAKPTYAELEQKIDDLIAKVREQTAIEAKYRYLVDSTSDSLYLVDINARYLFMNHNHAQRLKIPKAKASGLFYKDFHSPEQSAEFEARVRTVYETGISIHDEYQSSRDNGYFLRTFSPVRDSDESKNIIAVSVVSKDITQRRKAEESLRTSEEKYRQLIEYSTEAIFILTDGKVSFANSQTERMLGYSLDDLQLISFINLVISEDREMVFERQKAILRGEASAGNSTFRIVNKEGSTVWVATNSVTIQWENLPATLNFMRDITRQKKTETRLMQAQKMESIGTLAGGIAHDFNNLLMGIQGHTSLALLKLDKNDPNYEHIKTIESLVMSGASLTKQLLGFARGGKYEVKRANVNALIEKTLNTVGRAKKEIRIHHQLESHLWPTDIDQGQVEQVLLNILVNAWQAMPAGGDLYVVTQNTLLDESRFKAYSGKSGHYVKISITDTGIGMDEKTRERIFEPFFTTREMGRGTGLGLASVYGIVKNHNGFINVYSEKGQGSTFNIYLPASVKQDKEEKHLMEDASIEVPLGTETILLVDDEVMILDVACAMLKTLGYTVIAAQDGATALDLYRKRLDRIDLVILDMVMPDMNGGDVFDELKKINSGVKVLLSSGYSLNGQASKIMGRGCDGFIQKPFTLGEVSRQLRNILGPSPQQSLRESEQIPLPIFDTP